MESSAITATTRVAPSRRNTAAAIEGAATHRVSSSARTACSWWRSITPVCPGASGSSVRMGLSMRGQWLRGSSGGKGHGRVHRPGAGQREVEHRALARGGFGADAAAVALDDTPHRGQANAGAFELAGHVQALERFEELVGVLHVEAAAVVADIEGEGRVSVGVVLADKLFKPFQR